MFLAFIDENARQVQNYKHDNCKQLLVHFDKMSQFNVCESRKPSKIFYN